MQTVKDSTGITLTPCQPERCEGNGETPDGKGGFIECCCDECDYLLECWKASSPNEARRRENLESI